MWQLELARFRRGAGVGRRPGVGAAFRHRASSRRSRQLVSRHGRVAGFSVWIARSCSRARGAVVGWVLLGDESARASVGRPPLLSLASNESKDRIVVGFFLCRRMVRVYHRFDGAGFLFWYFFLCGQVRLCWCVKIGGVQLDYWCTGFLNLCLGNFLF